MLIDIGGRILNTDFIRSIETISGRPDACAVIWSDGSREELSYSLEFFDRFVGSYVPAASGFTQITAYIDDGKVGFYDPVPIIAFRVSGESHYNISPVTLEGEASQFASEIDRDIYATVFPDGRCYDHREGGLPMPLNDWKADVARRLEREAGVKK